MTKFIARAYNSFEINKNTNSSIFKRSNEGRLRDEINYYLNLPEELKVFFPRVFSSKTEAVPFELELEYYAYSNLGNAAFSNKSSDFWRQTFASIGLYLKNCSQFTSSLSRSDSEAMFIKKTESEYKNLVSKFEYFDGLTNYPELIFNGRKLKSIDVIWPTISNFVKKSLFSENSQIIHGDLCFSNILFGINETNNDLIIKLIDPRGTFGASVLFGDIYYDLAKLSHSCNGGYEYFINDKFFIDTKDNCCDLVFIDDFRKNSQAAFADFVESNSFDKLKIKTIEGLIFVGMCARHYDSLDRQKAMFFTGLDLLNDVYEIMH